MDNNERNRLIEQFLPDVLESLTDYTQMGVDEDELVGEASLILTEVVDEHMKKPEGSLQDKIDAAINERLTAFITESNCLKAADQDLAERLNDLSDAAVSMVEELGRRPSNEELAEKLNLDVDEIERLLKISEEASRQ
ncbi:MAG: sigma-70 domain-containing protein [Lachnospiraceae bacterium]|nr:sigma-70 domain-containing protein [Lachnospiraceae bacterium]